ncbi:amidohydrolase [Neisseria chenwenguii]|uniref:Amidohydrolase n=2 Tax=Neisseria chenwenguii TaxID=1853278 RepID=A0A220S4M8_9NEIS|nr:amidohydrolase [Neisseria chenwenguii]
MAQVLQQAPYLADWGKDVADVFGEQDTSRPRINLAAETNRKLLDFGKNRIAEMDKQGIDTQILSLAGAPQFILDGKGVALIRTHNDQLAAAIRTYPQRFGGFASLPWQDPKAAVDEARRCVNELGLNGFLINGRPSGVFLDDARYLPVLKAISDLGKPLFLHPGIPIPTVQQAYYTGFNREVNARLSMFAWGWHHEVGVQTIRLILAGVFEKYPNLQVISGHWGELVPFYLQRLDDGLPQAATGLSRGITETYREHVYLTPSGMLSLPHLQFAQSVVGVDRILFSVDYPYLSLNGARNWLENLPIPYADKAKIAHQNAEKLFGTSF